MTRYASDPLLNPSEVTTMLKQWTEALEREIEHLAHLAFAGGDEVLQRGWWPYIEDAARELRIEKEVIARAKAMKAQHATSK